MTSRTSTPAGATLETYRTMHAYAAMMRETSATVDEQAAIIRDAYRLMLEALDPLTIAGNLLDPDRYEVTA